MTETTEKKELTPEEVHAQELEKWVRQCTDLMAVSKKADCPPEAVATVMLLNGLNAQIHFEGELLRLTLVSLFKPKVRVPDPRLLRGN